MKKIITGGILLGIGILLIFTGSSREKKVSVIDKYTYKYQESDYYNTNIVTSKYIDIFQEKLWKKYSQKWVEIQNFYAGNQSIRFAHIFSFKTFICGNGKLIMNTNGEEKEIFSFDKEKLAIQPCTFNIIQTKKDNIFLVDFCLSSGAGSGECLGIDMYYDINTDYWTEGKLFFTGYKEDKLIKLSINDNNRNWKSFKNDYDQFINYIKKYYIVN